MEGTSGRAPEVPVEELIDIARGVAGRLGASGPISIRHTATTRAAAEALPGPCPKIASVSGMDVGAPCYVVLIQGTFNPPRRPPRPELPQTEARSLSSIVLTVSADTGRIVGTRTVLTGGPSPDLTPLGPVTLDASDTTALDDWSPRRPAADLEALRDPFAPA